MAELGVVLAPANKQETFKKNVERYAAEKEEIKKEAEKLEAESKLWDERSEKEIHKHHRWSQATAFLQISIALAAIALLTRRRFLMWGVYGLSLTGIIVGLTAVF